MLNLLKDAYLFDVDWRVEHTRAVCLQCNQVLIERKWREIQIRNFKLCDLNLKKVF